VVLRQPAEEQRRLVLLARLLVHLPVHLVLLVLLSLLPVLPVLLRCSGCWC
jgi:hypothetical protein